MRRVVSRGFDPDTMQEVEVIRWIPETDEDVRKLAEAAERKGSRTPDGLSEPGRD
jgi:hypothetical protein